MSYYIDDRDPLANRQKQFKVFAFLITCAIALALILVLIQIGLRFYEWFNSPKTPKQQSSLNLSESEQFTSIFELIPNHYDPTLNRPVTLNLDPQLLNASNSANFKPWQLELNVDGSWTTLHDFISFYDLFKANPYVWRYLFAYQDTDNSIIAFDLRSLENIPLLTLETAQVWLTAQNFQTPSRLPLEKIELVGIANDQIFIYVSNALDEGTILSASYQEDLNWFKPEAWQIWPHISGKLARSQGQTFFLEGFQDGCGEVYTFYRLPSLTEETKITDQNQLEKIATTYSGCLEGDRFLGVDSRGRLLLSSVVANSHSGPNLDQTGTYQNVYAIPIASPQDQILILSNQEMPSSLNRVAFFPDIGADGLNPYSKLSDDNSSPDEASAAANLNDRVGENLILTSEDAVWRYNLSTEQLDSVGRLDQLFGQTIPRTWRGEELCLEIINRPELSSIDRLVSVNLETGVAMTGLINCQVQSSTLGPAVGGSTNRDYQLQRRLKEIDLPADFQLVRK